MREFEERHAPRWVKSGLSVGSGALFATGLFVGVVLRNVLLGVLLSHTLGFELRTENSLAEGMRWIEVAPKGSTTSLTLVRWFEDMPPGSLQGLVFAVDDVHATSKSFLARAFPSILGLGRCLVGYKRCFAILIATGL